MRCDTLPLGMPRCHTGTHRHRVVFDCVALYNVLSRHAPPLRWRETAVVFILCWHSLPLYWLANSAIVLCLAYIANESCDSFRAGATTSPLIIILCSQHTAFFIILCWHALPTSRVTHAVRELRQVLLLLFCVLNTPLFYYFVLARIANESCDSCRAGATTSPLIIILCLQHTAFLLFPPFLLARNVTVRGSRYSCCLGHRLLFPYMILFK